MTIMEKLYMDKSQFMKILFMYAILFKNFCICFPYISQEKPNLQYSMILCDSICIRENPKNITFIWQTWDILTRLVRT